MLSQWFDPEPGPAAVPGVLARAFVKGGHQVRALTAFPNYPEGKVYDGYRQRPRRTERMKDITITRVPVIPSHNRSVLGRVANYASFAVSATTFGAGALHDTDAIWVYNSPVTVALPLLAHSGLGRKPYFLHVQDLWPDSLIESGMLPRRWTGRGAEAVISRIVRLMERHAAVIGVISPSVRDLILERDSRLDPDRIVYVPNPTDESLFVPLGSKDDEVPDVPWSGRFTVMYAGAIGDVQGLDTVLDAASLLPPNEEIQIGFVGDGIARARLEAQARERRLSNVWFVGRVPKERVPLFMKTAHVHLVSLGKSKFLRHTTPSKIPSLFASAVPVIGQIAGDGAEMIEASGAGVVTKPGDARSLADAILFMAHRSQEALEERGRAGREFYERQLSADVVVGRILDAIAGRVRTTDVPTMNLSTTPRQEQQRNLDKEQTR